MRDICLFRSWAWNFRTQFTFKELMMCNTTKSYLEKILNKAKEETNYCQKIAHLPTELH